jgi:hypothetical protein
MDDQEISKIIHELSSMGQSCQSYYILLGNLSISVNRKKMSEICKKMARYCLEMRNKYLEGIKDG